MSREIRWPFHTLLALLTLALASCAGAPQRSNSGGIAVIENYFATLNRRDLLPLTLYVSPEVEWYSVVDGERLLEVSGLEALKAQLNRFFAGHARSAWHLVRANASGNFIMTVERSEWSEASGVEARESVGVYEIDAGRIRRMTYFLSKQ